LAGDIDEVKSRLKDTDFEALAKRLRGAKPSVADKPDAKPVPSAAGTEAPRLFFTLGAADAIPPCLTTVPPQVSRNRGPVDDLWDDGPKLGQTADGKPIEVATLLLVIVGLLSAEWLGRKLLRLA
jgi:hypothetical protein